MQDQVERFGITGFLMAMTDAEDSYTSKQNSDSCISTNVTWSSFMLTHSMFADLNMLVC